MDLAAFPPVPARYIRQSSLPQYCILLCLASESWGLVGFNPGGGDVPGRNTAPLGTPYKAPQFKRVARSVDWIEARPSSRLIWD